MPTVIISDYHTRSRTRARASSVSTSAKEKKVKVRDDFGESTPYPLTEKAGKLSVKTPSAPGAWDSDLTSVGKVSRTPSESGSAMRMVRSYSDVVRASSPVPDKVSQENQLTAAAIVEIAADSHANIFDGLSMEHAACETTSENSESPRDKDGDDLPWTTVAAASATKDK